MYLTDLEETNYKNASKAINELMKIMEAIGDMKFAVTDAIYKGKNEGIRCGSLQNITIIVRDATIQELCRLLRKIVTWQVDYDIKDEDITIIKDNHEMFLKGWVIK